MTFRLQSCGGEIFPVPLATAVKFGTLRTLLETVADFGPDFDEILPLPNVDSASLRTLIDWARESASLKLDKPSRLLDLVLAANFLHAPEVVDSACLQISALVSNKSAEELRVALGLESDLLEETHPPCDEAHNSRYGRTRSTLEDQVLVGWSPKLNHL